MATILYLCLLRTMSDSSDLSNHTGTLFIVPTPIGNLTDITQRALDILSNVAAIGCEDTRHSRILLQHFGITTPTFAIHDHNESSQVNKVIQRLEKGDDIALVSDAGTPLISDPGFVLVRECRTQGYKVSALPGPCALTTALSAAGLPTDQFHFFGFLPVKQQAKIAQLRQLNQHDFTSVFYESPRRVLDTMRLAQTELSEQITVVLAKELTKSFESYISGSCQTVINWLEEDSAHQKGEFVLMFGPAPQVSDDISEPAKQLMQSLLSELPAKKASAIVAQHYQHKKNALYQWALEQKK